MTFKFHSNEIHSTPKGTVQNSVNINNGKGTKVTTMYNSAGKKLYTKTKKLNTSELSNIKSRKFMPTLFSSMRKGIRKTRRANI